LTYMCIHYLGHPFTPPPHHCPASGQNLFHPLVLSFCWRENIRDVKKDTVFCWFELKIAIQRDS
jgi:hypothetical protein